MGKVSVFVSGAKRSTNGGKSSYKKENSDKKTGSHQVREVEERHEKMATEINVLKVQEVAEILRISRFSVYKLVKRGDLPAMKVLNKLRFNPEDVEWYLSKCKING